MKAITIKQPWASLIVEGIKDIENRTWATKFRGRVLIHASAKPVVGLPCEALTDEQYARVFTAKKLNSLIGENGAIIGSVEIVDCVINHPSIWAEKTPDYIMKGDEEWNGIPIYNWVLANPVKYAKPIPAKGKLSFWEFPMPMEEYFYLEKIGAIKFEVVLQIKSPDGDWKDIKSFPSDACFELAQHFQDEIELMEREFKQDLLKHETRTINRAIQ